MKSLRTIRVITILLLSFLTSQVSASLIYVIGNSHGQVTNARNGLIAAGHSVTFSGSTLSDYSAYDQVWDLRYSSNLGAADISAMGSFLAAGGRMYMTGEHSGFDASRNNSLVSFLNSVGAGSLTLAGSSGGSQSITTAGQIVNSPNTFSSISFNAAQGVGAANVGNGFQVSVDGANRTGLIGWDFGDIVGASQARLLVGFDIEIFQNGYNWTENMATYLATPVPAPAGIMLFGLGLIGLGLRRQRS